MLASLLLAGCGGGGGSAASVPLPVRSGPLYFGYFETVPGQIEATVPGINWVHCQDESAFGDPAAREWRKTQIVECLQSARARGIRLAIVSVGFLVFDAKLHFVGTQELQAFKEELNAADLTQMVAALYPLDEPELHGQSDAEMSAVFNACRAVFPQAKMAVIYSAKGPTPGIAAADWIGRDDYGRGTGVLSELPAIRADQQYLLVPGGANPWRQDPAPFYQFALQNSNVVGILSFIYGPYPASGGEQQGIGTNGMLPQYQRVGCTITGKC